MAALAIGGLCVLGGCHGHGHYSYHGGHHGYSGHQGHHGHHGSDDWLVPVLVIWALFHAFG